MKLQAGYKMVLIAAVICCAAVQAYGLDPADVVRLKAAGVGDAVLEALVREKSLETAAFTVEEVSKMKTAGVGDAALVRMIEEKSSVRGEKEVVYGKEMRPAAQATVSDIMELKNAGISDKVINTIVRNQTLDPDIEEQRRALEILRRMGLMFNVRRPLPAP